MSTTEQDAGPSTSEVNTTGAASPINVAPVPPPNASYGRRRMVVDLSSLPLQILLHLNVYFFLLYWICELLIYVYKGIMLPFPDVGGTLALEIILLFFIAVIEGFRLFFGYKGNLGERKQTLIWSVILALPILVSQLYMMLWQTYVLRAEVILCAILFIMVSLEVLLSAATIWTFQRHESFIHG
ncbi:transmembrane protein 216-like [Hydractinia symbiolongicarpus]|uniref:transmembrane protein 216-like n=1 Tax=Hydractinia symbiolongicarpus TaxID=13093 RepID=UPI00254C6FB7|nr:transmembrane protein 216-like [Hydractinia symbiolongicarpus]